MKVRIGWQTLVAAALLLTASAGVAEAKSVGGCPIAGGFSLRSVEELGIDPDVATGIPSLDGNRDGLTCIKPITIQDQEGFIFRDNTVGA